MQLLNDTANNLQILQCHTQIAPPTHSNISVNHSKKWSKSNYPTTLLHNNTPTPTPQLPDKPTPKIPPSIQLLHRWLLYKTQRNCPWGMEKRKSWIPHLQPKGLHIAKRLLGHQNILRAEMMAIHKTLRIINTQFPNEPAFIFTDSLNVLYLLNTQIKHPTLHNSHPDQVTLNSMVKILQDRTQLPLYYVSYMQLKRTKHLATCTTYM